MNPILDIILSRSVDTHAYPKKHIMDSILKAKEDSITAAEHAAKYIDTTMTDSSAVTPVGTMPGNISDDHTMILYCAVISVIFIMLCVIIYFATYRHRIELKR